MRRIWLRFLRPPFLVVESDARMSRHDAEQIKAAFERALNGDGRMQVIVLAKGLRIATVYPLLFSAAMLVLGVALGVLVARWIP